MRFCPSFRIAVVPLGQPFESESLRIRLWLIRKGAYTSRISRFLTSKKAH